jgi:hypothetical protein
VAAEVRTRVHFAAYRLKYSRWVCVGLVPDERVEALLRALLVAFEASAGVPLCVVFDRPKTVVVGKDEHGRPIWNPTLAQAAIAYGFTIVLCAPRRPEQKGSVENCVGTRWFSVVVWTNSKTCFSPLLVKPARPDRDSGPNPSTMARKSGAMVRGLACSLRDRVRNTGGQYHEPDVGESCLPLIDRIYGQMMEHPTHCPPPQKNATGKSPT